MRADRLVAAILFMQAKTRVTARELAAELEVSVATARRDLEALAMAGVPVYPQRGRRGGWTLLGGARTDLSGLTAPEAHALFLLLGPAASASGEAKTALRKLVRALPRTFRPAAETAATATIVDSTGWGGTRRDRPQLVETLQAAIIAGCKIRMTYVNRAGDRSERVVEPWGLVDKDDTWYLMAGTQRGRRTFRLDRMTEAAAIDEPAHRPDDFTLAEAWEEVVADIEKHRSRTRVTVRIESRFAPILFDHFGRHAEMKAEDAGWARVEVAAPTPLDVARTLAGWGGAVEVLDSEPVRRQLARIGRELVELHADAAPAPRERSGGGDGSTSS